MEIKSNLDYLCSEDIDDFEFNLKTIIYVVSNRKNLESVYRPCLKSALALLT